MRALFDDGESEQIEEVPEVEALDSALDDGQLTERAKVLVLYLLLCHVILHVIDDLDVNLLKLVRQLLYFLI